jgi:hypothetical protein
MDGDGRALTMRECPTLRHLLGAYLHQDWADEFPTVWEGVTAFMRDEPAMVDPLRADVDTLLAEGRSEDALRRLLVDECGIGYWAPGDGLSFSEWLAELRARLTQKDGRGLGAL